MLELVEREQEAAPPQSAALRDEIRRQVPMVLLPPSFDDVARHEQLMHERQDILRPGEPPARPGRFARLRAVLRRKVNDASRWLLHRQVEFNVGTLGFARAATRLLRTQDANLNEVVVAASALQREVERLRVRQRQMEEKLAVMEAELTTVRLRAAPAPRRAAAPTRRPEPRGAELAGGLAIEARLRGSRHAVMQRLAHYLDLFRGAGKILDLAARRGELVELLEREGIAAWGVEEDADCAAYCQDMELPVEHGAAAAILLEQADASVGGIFLNNALERLSPEAAGGLLRLCRERLQPGGVLVAEAVNPHCPTALASFSNDPARLRPASPELLRLLLEGQGMRVQELIFLNPVTDDVPPVCRVQDGPPARAASYLDYAIVGRK